LTTRRREVPPMLTRRRLGLVHIFFFTVAASAPLTVLAGGVTTVFAVTGIVGFPLSYLILAVALGLFVVGYAAMSRHVANAGAFYSYLANGLGRQWGVAGAFVALVAYNAIQIGLYGLFGVGLGAFMAENFSLDLAWWVWALIALVVVGTLGVLRVDLNANILAVLLILEIIAVIVYDVVAFTHPADGTVGTEALQPSELFVPGVGAAFAFAVASFVGFESGAIYSEEVRNPRHTVARATYAALAFTGLFYALSAWAMTVNVGPENLQQAAIEAGPGLVFGPIAEFASTLFADIANVLFLTSVLAALLSFHNGVARYFFALGRERVLPSPLSRVGVRSGAPFAGSLLQSTIALIVVLVFVWTDRDPLLDLFTWLSGMAAVGVILLMTGASASVVGYFSGRTGEESLWQRTIAPTLATIVLGALVALLVVEFDTLLGADPTSALRWILPGLVLLAAVLGLVWGMVLRASRPEVYEGIGRSALEPPAEDDDGIEMSSMLR
jgi:amino acid transporter